MEPVNSKLLVLTSGMNSAGRLEGPDRTTASRGSFEYRSPEGHLANQVTEKADIFAIGLAFSLSISYISN